MKPSRLRFALRFYSLLALPLWLLGCAAHPPSATVSIASPAQWNAPLPAQRPHQGQQSHLRQWWTRFDDPLLLEVIAAAQAASPTLASAVARIAHAQATQQLSDASLHPVVNASATTSRGPQTTLPSIPLAQLTQTRLQTTWETDLFGVLAANRRAAQARTEGAQAQWHDARVSVAAEAANLYFNWRSCQAQLALVQSDSVSRATTARLMQRTAQAGFATAAAAALAQASAAEGASRAIQQQAQCNTDLKGLVALTAIEEPILKQKLLYAPVNNQYEATFTIASIPAQALTQRPDLYNLEREVAAASAEVGNAQVERYPRLTLGGSLGLMSLRMSHSATSISTWNFGPFTLNMPVFDGGKFEANLSSAQAHYVEAAALYRARARQAVREVEEALVALDSANARQAQVQMATSSYHSAFTSTQARYQAGIASLADLEDARRSTLSAQSALLTYQRERLSAWIALYRAVGGGWTQAEALAPPSNTPSESAS